MTNGNINSVIAGVQMQYEVCNLEPQKDSCKNFYISTAFSVLKIVFLSFLPWTC